MTIVLALLSLLALAVAIAGGRISSLARSQGTRIVYLFLGIALLIAAGVSGVLDGYERAALQATEAPPAPRIYNLMVVGDDAMPGTISRANPVYDTALQAF